MITKPFTYLLYHIPSGKWYYGVKYAVGCNPTDLWTTYFSSSEPVKALIEEYGKDSFKVEVRRTFNTTEEALYWESRVLCRMKVVTNPMCLNRSIGGGTGFYSNERSAETRQKISDGVKKFNKLNPSKVSRARTKGAKTFWKNMSPETREQILRQRRNQKNPMKGKKQRRVSCTKCRLETSINAFTRHIKTCKN